MDGEGDEVGVESSQGAEKAESPSASASPGAAGPGAVPHPHLANASVPASHPPSGDLQRHGSDRPGGHWRHRVKKWCEEVYQCWPWNGQETLERIRIVIIVSFLFTALLIIINLFLSFLLPPTSDALSSCFPSSRGIPVSLQKLIEGGALLVYPGRPPPT
ncbi:unnamed protein product [Darwinula stevensoni]|uniref:Uncharacterized protein n=1 Tax=Darwinula stevensoni TaxID=69355 RepID=A0A7R9A4B1_9CRUS|nr:unnamed protein product [Darwinula stevensoni]CAG0883010.1 unnamed protein product [Darwinula stevensoni]